MISFLSSTTYMVRHNPNCPKPFEVRLCGEAGRVDPLEPRNAVGFGMSADEAAADALKVEVDRLAAQNHIKANKLFRKIWEGL